MAELIQPAPGGPAEREREGRSFAERPGAQADLDDLIHSWRRLNDPAVRRLAVRLVRMLGDEQPDAHRSSGFAADYDRS